MAKQQSWSSRLAQPSSGRGHQGAISYKINSSFHHISRSHNEIADALAKNAHCLNVSFEASCGNCFHQHGCNIINNLCNMPPWVNCCISLPLMIFLPFWAFSLKTTPIYVSIIFLVKNNKIIFFYCILFPLIWFRHSCGAKYVKTIFFCNVAVDFDLIPPFLWCKICISFVYKRDEKRTYRWHSSFLSFFATIATW